MKNSDVALLVSRIASLSAASVDAAADVLVASGHLTKAGKTQLVLAYAAQIQKRAAENA